MGGDEELARGMGRMDPFGYSGNQFGGNGGRYGMQNQFDPPRPAPNADGWSSGDDYLTWNDQQQGQDAQFGGQQNHMNNHFQHQQHQQQQQQQQQHRTPAQSRLQYNQQHYQRQQQQQQQQQWNQALHHQQWNIAASEFVPK